MFALRRSGREDLVGTQRLRCASLLFIAHSLAIGIGDACGSLSVAELDVQLPSKKFADEEVTFWETMKSRVMVENVVAQTKAQAVFSFDFLCLCVVASILAALGLAADSAVVVVASMLVSPIMGPILAVTFGSVVRDWSLVRAGLLSELMSLLICVFDGRYAPRRRPSG